MEGGGLLASQMKTKSLAFQSQSESFPPTVSWSTRQFVRKAWDQCYLHYGSAASYHRVTPNRLGVLVAHLGRCDVFLAFLASLTADAVLAGVWRWGRTLFVHAIMSCTCVMVCIEFDSVRNTNVHMCAV